MGMLRRVAAAGSWAICGTMAAWLYLFWASQTVGLPSGLVGVAAWLRSVEPVWLWSADRSLVWYEMLCATVLSLWLRSRPADRRGVYLRVGFWLAALNPFWPQAALLALAVAIGPRP